MKAKTISALVLFFLAFNVQASGDDKKDDTARSDMIRVGIKSCKERQFKTVGEYDECVHEYSVKANRLYPERGTDEYAKKHYGELTPAQAEAQLLKLKGEYETADSKSCRFCPGKKAGEVSRIAISKEGWWIQKNILNSRVMEGGDPFFVECKGGLKSSGIVRTCPLGKGGAR